MKRRIILLGILSATISLPSFAQKKSIIGTITSSENGNPIGGIIVMVKGTHQGLVTADDGYFDLIVSEGDTIELSSRYFVDREVVVGADFKYNINLDEKYGQKRTGYLFQQIDRKEENVLMQNTSSSINK
jgi:hypothetical protein